MGDTISVYDVRHVEARWQLSKRRGRVLGVYEQRDSALDVANIVARANPPSEVWLYDADGASRLIATYSDEPPDGDASEDG